LAVSFGSDGYSRKYFHPFSAVVLQVDFEVQVFLLILHPAVRYWHPVFGYRSGGSVSALFPPLLAFLLYLG